LCIARDTFKGKGRIYCTTQRIIFVAEKGAMQHGIFFESFVGFTSHLYPTKSKANA
jgi:hypothetical protein